MLCETRIADPEELRPSGLTCCRFTSPLSQALSPSDCATGCAADAACWKSYPGAHVAELGAARPLTAEDYECGLALAANLRDYPALAQCAVGLAELHIGRRDLAAAAAVFDSCVVVCAAIPDAAMRATLLRRVLPMSVEVLSMQGRTEESYARWCLLGQVLAESGRQVPTECAICAEGFTSHRACIVLGCGHGFHRDCCDAWMGGHMLATEVFRAECPECRCPDPALKPTPAALQALEDRRRVFLENRTASGCAYSSDCDNSSSYGSSNNKSGEGSESDYDSDAESESKNCCSASNSNEGRSKMECSASSLNRRVCMSTPM